MASVFARRRKAARMNANLSISDPRLPRWLGIDSAAGTVVNEQTALTISAFWRAAMLISSSAAGLPLRTVREWGQTRQHVSSWLDSPGKAVGFRAFNWKQTSFLHLLLGGDSFQRHLYNGLGMLAGLEPIDPGCVTSYWDSSLPGGKRHEVMILRDGKMIRETHDERTLTQIMGPTLDGLRGMSLVGVARTSLGSLIAADHAAAHTFRNGPMIGGILTAEDDPEDDDEADKIQAIIDDRLVGSDNAGKVVVLERKYNLTPWTMTLKDAQFLEQRQFGVQDVARWTGVHPVFLMDPGAVSTWGTGVEILQRGLGRFTLPQYTDPFQEAMSDLLPNKSWAEFDFKALERGSPQEEIALIIEQIDGGLLTINQALALVNRPGIGPSGDVLRLHGQPLNPDAAQVNPTSAVPAPGEAVPSNAELAVMMGVNVL